MSKDLLPGDRLSALRQFTAARIAIGRVGNSVPLKQSLELKLAHAHARDAVYSVLDVEGLFDRLKIFDLQQLHLHSRAINREEYLQRPDLGRRLGEEYEHLLYGHILKPDIAVIIADGLSAEAVNENSPGLLKILLPKLTAAKLSIAPICLVEQGRVAIGDDISYALKAKLSLVLIGERPGLSSADSMGAYLTYNPGPGLTDEARNCVSNIRKHGLSYTKAADKIFYLINEAFKKEFSGVGLKDNTGLLG